MKLLVVFLLSIHSVGGIRDPFHRTMESLMLIKAGESSCSGVCISNRVVLTCGRCKALNDWNSTELYAGGSKTPDGGGVKMVRYTKDEEVAIIITWQEMTTCEPFKLPCKKRDVPISGETTKIMGWRLESGTLQKAHAIMEWGADNTCCRKKFAGVNFNGRKNICMLPTAPSEYWCFSDCGAPVIKDHRVVGIITRKSATICKNNKCSLVASLYPILGELLGTSGAGAFMDDQYSFPHFYVTSTVSLPWKAEPTEEPSCIPVDAIFLPDPVTPGPCAGTTVLYGDSAGASCTEKRPQRQGTVIVKRRIVQCAANKLKRLTGCPCCTTGIVRLHCYKCKDPK